MKHHPIIQLLSALSLIDGTRIAAGGNSLSDILGNLFGEPRQPDPNALLAFMDEGTGQVVQFDTEESEQIRALMEAAKARSYRQTVLARYANGLEVEKFATNTDSLRAVSAAINADLGLNKIPKQYISAASGIIDEIEDLLRPNEPTPAAPTPTESPLETQEPQTPSAEPPPAGDSSTNPPPAE